MKWTFHVPQMTMDDLGLIPYWFVDGDERTTKEIVEANYQHGGGFRPIAKFTLSDDNSLKYPGDPRLKPLASAKHGNELLVFYDYAILAIIQPDRSFQVIRVD